MSQLVRVLVLEQELGLGLDNMNLKMDLVQVLGSTNQMLELVKVLVMDSNPNRSLNQLLNNMVLIVDNTNYTDQYLTMIDLSQMHLFN